jgi:hypothetical protein
MNAFRFLSAAAVAGLIASASAGAQTISLNARITGEVVPGVYGEVVIGSQPPPPVVYEQPVLIAPAPVVVGAPRPEPMYLHVPPGHAKNWRKYCHEYHACNRPVYFVKSAEYEPGYHKHDHDHDHGHGHDRDHQG